MKRILPFLLVFFCTACHPSAPEASSVSSPVFTEAPTSFLVLLDYGHGGADGGAVGTHTGVVEAELNFSIGEQVKEQLELLGVTVLLTRTDEKALGETKQADMQRRGELLQNPDADCTVSIHMNFFPDPSVKGPMVYYQAGSESGEQFATLVMNALTTALDRPERLPNPGNHFVTRVPTAPSVLVECGFLSHQEEERLLQDGDYQRLLARAISEGVYAFCTQSACETTPFVVS